ncbi:cyclic amp receptor-like protein g [Anaeramoeba ignava]|uniref:Cyclic amp receptor-like protein g n=1 Tax=Anaeramoeba ignava TaxID=1746090 RepID=A0A9Q0RCJ6_ANAIG|nr:cyclic amp receptor-like protein g [Anaeramoeba ignava]
MRSIIRPKNDYIFGKVGYFVFILNLLYINFGVKFYSKIGSNILEDESKRIISNSNNNNNNNNNNNDNDNNNKDNDNDNDNNER